MDMKKNTIKLNESQLRKIISESIKRTILEYDDGYFCTDKDMIRDNIIGHLGPLLGTVKGWIIDACEKKIDKHGYEGRALACINKIMYYYDKRYEEGREKGLLLEYWTDYGDPPVDTRSKDEKITSHMKYLRAVMENERDSIIDICKNTKMDLEELGKFGVAMFDELIGILGKYGF